MTSYKLQSSSWLLSISFYEKKMQKNVLPLVGFEPHLLFVQQKAKISVWSIEKLAHVSFHFCFKRIFCQANWVNQNL